MVVGGCSGIVSGSNTSTTTPPSTLTITNVQAVSHTTSSSQIAWTTNVAADSAVDYGTSPSFGNNQSGGGRKWRDGNAEWSHGRDHNGR